VLKGKHKKSHQSFWRRGEENRIPLEKGKAKGKRGEVEPRRYKRKKFAPRRKGCGDKIDKNAANLSGGSKKSRPLKEREKERGGNLGEMPSHHPKKRGVNKTDKVALGRGQQH